MFRTSRRVSFWEFLEGSPPEQDIHCLVRFLEIAIAFVDFFLALFVVRRTWVGSILECSPELVALLSGVVVVQMPWTLLFDQVFEDARGLFGVVLRRALYSRDCVVWLTLAVKTRVVIVVATPMILVVVVVVAARVVLALVANGAVLGVCLVLFVSP
jgi:hypothetical protein